MIYGSKRMKILPLMVILAIILTNIPITLATELSTPTILTQDASTFSVTIPTSLPITVEADGNVLVAENLRVENNSYGPVVITNVTIEDKNGWVMVPYGTDFKRKKVGLKEFTLQLQAGHLQQYLQTDKPINMTVTKNLPLTYLADISTQKEAITGVEIAKVIFTVGWDVDKSEGVETVYLAQDSDFEGTKNGGFTYIGTEKEIEIPHIIKGVNVTSYKEMFMGKSVTKVVSTNTNIEDMTCMFMDLNSTTLDISNLDTTNVYSMSGMFDSSKLENLDVSNMDTTNVIEMDHMFSDTPITIIDVSNFDTSRVETMSGMFYDTNAPILEVNKFNTSNVTEMVSMFARSKAQILDVSNFDTSKVQDMSFMFEDGSVSSLDMSKFTILAETYIDGIFSGLELGKSYARTQAEADRLNDEDRTGINKPVFVVR